MKMIIKPIFFGCLFMLTLLSCNNEELFVEDNSEIIDPTTPEDGKEDNEDGPGHVDITTPCDFNLDAVAANSTVIINCVMDLGGKTINLPANVTIVYEGGDIINGTLNFSNNNTISGELMNSSLTMTGSKPLLKDTTFTFDPKRWGIVEGETTSAIAQKNNNILEKTMFDVKKLGISTFKIDRMDAYFEVSKVTSTTTNQNFYPELEAVNIPSDFNLEMTDNTILRVFPTVGNVSASLLGIANSSNITVKGGVLYGDRDLREYSKANAEDGSLLLTIRSGKNITLDGIKFTMSSRTALTINSYGFTFSQDYNPSSNISVKNCVFNKNRAMSFSITDGHNILVENNIFIDTAQATSHSDGGVVGFAINIEPVRTRDSNTGELIYYQKVYDVVIRNNTEMNSRAGAFNIFLGDNIVIEKNIIETGVGYTFATNCHISNNDFKAKKDTSKPAIFAGGEGETVFGNEIYNNRITGYETGIAATHKNVNIFNNKINDCTIGIQLKKSTNMKIYGNIIKNSKGFSRGVQAHIADVNNVDIFDNDINVVTNPIYFVQLNKLNTSANFNVKVFDNILSTDGFISFEDSNGVSFYNNIVKGGLQLGTVSNIKISDNTISTLDKHGIHLTKINSNVLINLNKITVGGTNKRFQCLKDESTNTNEIVINSNSCE